MLLVLIGLALFVLVFVIALLDQGKKRSNRFYPTVEEFEPRIVMDSNSAGAMGIEALGLGLTGQDVHIGQVEEGRPGLRGYVNPAQPAIAENNANSHPHVKPVEVLLQDKPAEANKDTLDRNYHATAMAGIMNGKGPSPNQGVAPGALLHASAYRTKGAGPGFQHALLSMQQVVSQGNVHVPAVNMSWTKKPAPAAPGAPGDKIDGLSLLSLGTDYLAQKHDALYVVALSNEFGESDLLPADAYNVLTVGAARPLPNSMQFGQVVTSGFTDTNERRLTDLIAPGQDINAPIPNGTVLGGYMKRNGSSTAVAHATGTIALLVEDARAKKMPDSAEFQEVQKAILMNSAEKIKGPLKMGRTVTVQDRVRGETTWNDSDARDDPGNKDADGKERGRTLPLDARMGFGFLNARRAVEQLEGGKFKPGKVGDSAIGWDFGSIAGLGAVNKYVLPTLKEGGWISITLTWNRMVTLQKKAGNNDANQYEIGDNFVKPRLSNLVSDAQGRDRHQPKRLVVHQHQIDQARS